MKRKYGMASMNLSYSFLSMVESDDDYKLVLKTKKQ
jgi:hypothetical protein